MRVVLVGPPGAGKGTQAEFVSSYLGIPKISTGDIFRLNVADETPLGLQAASYMEDGGLVPDEVTIGMVHDRLAEDDVADGFLLDGFPRTVPQAESLEKLLDQLDAPLDVVLELVVDDDEVVRRLSGRRTCRRCNHVWHLNFDPAKVEDVCDSCGGQLYQRRDDRAEIVRRRLDVYANETAPIVGFYADRRLLSGIDATGPVESVTERAISALRRFDAGR